jgi:hypothetical protein
MIYDTNYLGLHLSDLMLVRECKLTVERWFGVIPDLTKMGRKCDNWMNSENCMRELVQLKGKPSFAQKQAFFLEVRSPHDCPQSDGVNSFYL